MFENQPWSEGEIILLAHLNDFFRTTFEDGMGDVTVSDGIMDLELSEDHLTAILKTVMDGKQSFQNNERSIGTIGVDLGKGRQFFIWKIVYYSSREMERLSEDPFVASKIWRLLTVMTPAES